MNSKEAVGLIVVMVLLVAVGIGVGYGVGTTVPKPAPAVVTTSSTSQGPPTAASASAFDLTLVITTNNYYNSTVGDQPAYFVLGPNGTLESSASISLPAHRLIRLTIICYDNGSATLTSPQYAVVAGTQGNAVTEINNDNVNSTQGASGIQVLGGQSVTSTPANNTAHTFTIPQLGINIPVEPSSTVVAYFTISQAGTYSWFCQTECGYGPTGLEGAMDTPGWMTGSVTAS